MRRPILGLLILVSTYAASAERPAGRVNADQSLAGFVLSQFERQKIELVPGCSAVVRAGTGRGHDVKFVGIPSETCGQQMRQWLTGSLGSPKSNGARGPEAISVWARGDERLTLAVEKPNRWVLTYLGSPERANEVSAEQMLEADNKSLAEFLIDHVEQQPIDFGQGCHAIKAGGHSEYDYVRAFTGFPLEIVLFGVPSGSCGRVLSHYFTRKFGRGISEASTDLASINTFHHDGLAPLNNPHRRSLSSENVGPKWSPLMEVPALSFTTWKRGHEKITLGIEGKYWFVGYSELDRHER